MKKNLTTIILVISMALCMIGCGKEESKSNGELFTSVTVNDEAEETVQADETENNKTASEIDASDALLEEKAQASMTAYENFLNGSGEIYFDKEYPVLPEYSADGMDQGIFTNSDHFDFRGFVDAISAGQTLYWCQDYEPKSIKYAYIDCGSDGIPELVLLFSETGILYDAYSDIFVMKEIDGKVQLCYWEEYGERTDLLINEYGYVRYEGSGGASTYSYTYYYINADGDVKKAYTKNEEYYVGYIYSPGKSVNFEDIGTELGVLDNMIYYTYDFKEDVYYYYDENYDYDTDVLSLMYIYYRTENYEPVSDPSVYEEASPYKRFWNETGLPLYTEEEIREAVWERNAELGATDKIVNGANVLQWKTIK